MMALSCFRKQCGADSSFAAWLKLTRPLTSLNSLRLILGLDHISRLSGSAAPVSEAISPRLSPLA
jgi:hypothetical protein